jgi:hypothetical protein
MKELLRSKVWFPLMTKLVEDAVIQCVPCRLNSVGVHEPMKLMPMPSKVWDELSMDFYGPLPNGHELLVIVDDASRNVVVIEVTTTAAKYVVPKLDELFSFIGFPTVLKSDNGPPFNGNEFADYCKQMGIHHRKVTPEHPKANGRAEKFMISIAKIIRSAIAEGKDHWLELNAFLRNYRSTPHPATGIAPSVLLFHRDTTSKLPEAKITASAAELMNQAQLRNRETQLKMKEYADKHQLAKFHPISVGDVVFAKQKRTNKHMTRFSPVEYVVTAVKHSMVSVRDNNSGKEFTRDRSFFVLKGEENNSYYWPNETTATSEPAAIVSEEAATATSNASSVPTTEVSAEESLPAETLRTDEESETELIEPTSMPTAPIEVRRSSRAKAPIDRLGIERSSR